jgi:hypothetical protein
MSDANIHGYKFPRPVLDAHGLAVRPSAEPRNTPAPADNAATRAAPLGFRDTRMENRK